MAGSLIVSERTGDETIWYQYDSAARLVAMVVGGVRYNYVRNAQNDIIGLIDKAGKRVVSYKYDSWGKAISTIGTLAATIGKKNPFRYRGYYFDAESGMYYLQSRYYDVEIRRFISADDVDVLDADEEFYYKNLYAYCDSNSVGRTDEAGNMWAVAIPEMAMMAAAFAEVLIPVTIVVAVAAVVVVGAVELGEAIRYSRSRHRSKRGTARPGLKKQQRENYEKKKQKDWKKNSGKRPRDQPRPHHPSKRGHRKYSGFTKATV